MKTAMAGRLLPGAAGVALALVATSGAALAGPSLEARLAAVARPRGATVGVQVEHLERHESAGINAARPFPLASTFKLPLAIVALRAVERHELPALDAPIHLEVTDMIPWASPLHARMPTGGAVTLREALTALLEESDNSAADALLRLLGGPARVRAALVTLGTGGLSIDRDEAQIALDSTGAALAPAERTAAKLEAVTASVPRAQHRAALARLRKDPRDHASPAAMARVLARLWAGALLSPLHTAFVREAMGRCRTGVRRLRAGVPAGTPVADRTGSCGGLDEGAAVCANDVGVLTLPSGEHVAIAAFVEDAGGPLAAKEAVLAAVARAVWAHYAGL